MNYKAAVVHGANPKQIHAQNRAHAGASLYKEGKVHVIVTTGKYEADELAQIVLLDGVPENAIRTEAKSRTTYQMLRNMVSEIFSELEDSNHTLQMSYFVSQQWHADRLMYVAHHVIGSRYPYVFHPVPDGRRQEEVDADIRLERIKMLVDSTTLFLPVGRGLLNSLAYHTLSAIRR